ncbi:MAG TPA: hypothetical protein VK611_17970 [Acidimicrobiales bacterium]|nr:hypothetical protein [Acidimicrobiales bacterium]
MLGRKDYTREELDGARAAMEAQLAAYRGLSGVSPGDEFEWRLFNNMVLVLDRYFVHRIRPVAGKDGNPLNEVELICESLLGNQGVFRGNKVLKYVPEESVLKLGVGDEIRLSADDFERLAAGFLAELERRFVAPAQAG